MIIRFLMLWLLAFAVLGCDDNGLNLKVRYNEIRGLKEGDRVIFEKNHVGQVMGVSYSKKGYYVVDVEIKREFENCITEYARFFIVADPQNTPRKAIEIRQIREGGTLLADGAIVKGSDGSSESEHGRRNEFSKNLEGLKKQFEALHRIRDTEEEVHDRVLSRLRFELKRLEADMAKALRSAKRKGRKKTARTKKAATTEGGPSADRLVPLKSRAHSGGGAGSRTSAKHTAQQLPPEYKRVMDVLRLLQIDHRADLSELHYDKVLKWIDMLERYESVDAKTLKSLNNIVKKYKLHYLFDGEEVERRFGP